MSMETDVLLRSMLYQIMMAESLKEAEAAIKVMCTKDVIAAVKEQVEEMKAQKQEAK